MHKELAVAIFASLIVLFLGCRSPERDKSEQRAQGSSDIQRSEKQSSPSSSGSSSGSGRIQDQDGEGQTPGTIIVLCPHFYIAHSEHLLSIFTRVYRLVYSHDAPYTGTPVYTIREKSLRPGKYHTKDGRRCCFTITDAMEVKNCGSRG